MINQIIIIKRTILEIDKPFLMSELFDKLRKKGISNKELILNVLDQLLNAGLVSYDDFKDDDPVYRSILTSAFTIA